MPANPTTQEMGERHEVFLAEVNSGTKSRASGSQWKDPADGRNSSDTPLPFAWDGKSTRGEGISVTRKMLAKIREQAMSERPQVGLRWYGNDALDIVDEDWIAVTAQDWAEVLDLARRMVELEAAHGDPAEAIETLTRQRDLEGRNALTLNRLLGESEQRYRDMTEAVGQGRFIPPAIPALPWTVVFQLHLEGRVENAGMHYEPTGKMTPFTVSTIRVERHMANRPRLIVNEAMVSEGDLYVDGVLQVRVSKSNPLCEKG